MAGDALWRARDGKRRPAVGVECGRGARVRLWSNWWENEHKVGLRNSPEWSPRMGELRGALATVTRCGAASSTWWGLWGREERKRVLGEGRGELEDVHEAYN